MKKYFIFLFLIQFFNAQSQQCIGSTNSFHVGENAQLSLWGNMFVNGTMSSADNAGVIFLGNVWENHPTLANLAPSAGSNIGGEFVFVALNNQKIKGGSTGIGDENSYFPNMTINNIGNVTLTGNEGCSGTFFFFNGKFDLDTFNFVVGTTSTKGDIRFYTPTEYFVTSAGTQPFQNGFLTRFSDNQNTDFPIGTLNSYSPARVRITAGTEQQMRIRVFAGAGSNGFGAMDFTTETCGKTWDVKNTSSTPTAELTLAHNKLEEGAFYDGASAQGFIMRHVGTAPNTSGGATSFNKWDMVPLGDPSVGIGTVCDIVEGNPLSTHSQHKRSMNAFGPFTKGIRGNVVPPSATLLFFNAVASGNNSLLTWSTSNETDNDGFFVEHSTDSINFTDLGFVDGAGTSSQNLSYSFTHFTPGIGKHFYRLRMLGLSGNISFSQVRVVIFNGVGIDEFHTAENAILSIYPNPTSGIFHVVSTIELGPYSIHDMNGKTLFHGEINATQKSFDITDFAPGMYYITLANQVYKIIKQ